MLFGEKEAPYHLISLALRISYDSLPVTLFVIPAKFLNTIITLLRHFLLC